MSRTTLTTWSLTAGFGGCLLGQTDKVVHVPVLDEFAIGDPPD